MKKIIFSVAVMFVTACGTDATKINAKGAGVMEESSKKAFYGIDEMKLEELMKKGTHVIDIRTPQEWQSTGIIEGATEAMFFDIRGQAHAQEWLESIENLGITKDTPFVIYCAHANRTKAVGNWLTKEQGYKHVMELDGGIEYGWIDKGKKTTKK